MEALIFGLGDHLTALHAHRTLLARHRRAPKVQTVRAWLRRWRRENATDLLAVTNPDRDRSHHRPAGGDAAARILHLNQLWELDSTPADVICADGKRYAIVAAIDIWSRQARVLVVPTSRATAIAALLRRCILEWGVPEAVRTDEGKDYTSRHVLGVLADLEIEHRPCPPYTPEAKPFVERFLGTLTRDLFATLPGFSGHDVTQAQALRSRKSFLLIHEAQQGCRDATYEPSRFPVAVPYPSPHRATPAYVVVTSSDLDTSRNKASVSGLSWISRYPFLLIHEAQQGCRDATYEPSRFPVAVPYPSPHRATPAYVVVTSSDLDTSRNKASVSGLSWISRKSFAARRGEDDTVIYGATLTVEELQERCDVWCDAVYGRRPHSGLGGVSPFARRASWPHPARRVHDEHALDALLAEPAGGGWRTVRKAGVRLDNADYIAGELGLLVGERVGIRRDPADPDQIFVYREDGTFICVAEDPGRTGADRAAIAARMTANYKASRVVALPNHGKRHQTPALTQAGRAAKAGAKADKAAVSPKHTATSASLAAAGALFLKDEE